MNKLILLLLAALIILAQANAQNETDATAEKCISEYRCSEWSECQDGFRTRTCSDANCGKRDILERSFCENAECTPDIQCDDWGQCTYTEKTDSLIKGKVSFGGYRSRVCRDANHCVPSFIQEGSCEDSYALQLSPIEECNEKFLAVIDPSSDRKIAKINLDSFRQNRLDLSFTQGEVQYCPSCFNAIKDTNEEGVDCGGSCKPCKTETKVLYAIALIFLWSGSLLFAFLSIREAVSLKKSSLDQIEVQNEF